MEPFDRLRVVSKVEPQTPTMEEPTKRGRVVALEALHHCLRPEDFLPRNRLLCRDKTRMDAFFVFAYFRSTP